MEKTQRNGMDPDGVSYNNPAYTQHPGDYSSYPQCPDCPEQEGYPSYNTKQTDFVPLLNASQGERTVREPLHIDHPAPCLWKPDHAGYDKLPNSPHLQQQRGYSQQQGNHPHFPVTTQPSNQSSATVVSLSGDQQDPEIQQLRKLNNGFLIFAIFVLCCFNIVFGAAAVALARCATQDYYMGYKKDGKCKSFTSLAVSLVGVVTGIIVIVLLVTHHLKLNSLSETTDF